MSQFDNGQWKSYPMGPKVKEWLEVSHSQYRGDQAKDIPADLREAFSEKVLTHMNEKPIDNEDMLIDIMDELVSMDLPLLVLKCADTFDHLWNRFDFRGLRAEGIAAMLVGESQRAINCFATAQKVSPEEPASYANLAQILMAEGRFEEAKSWLEAGFDADNNHHNLWYLYAQLLSNTCEFDSEAARKILTLAKERNSWAGLSLAAEMQEDYNQNTKAIILEGIYNSGERSHDFLIEYTGALGQSEQYDKIPAIVWQAESLTSQDLPWQLTLHKLQAQLAMDQHETFVEHAKKAVLQPGFPAEIKDQLRQFINQPQN